LPFHAVDHLPAKAGAVAQVDFTQLFFMNVAEQIRCGARMCRICNSFALIDPRAIDLAAAFMQRPLSLFFS
jgi:hypothetical protein